MTTMAPEGAVDEQVTVLSGLDWDMVEPCEIPQRAAAGGGGTPKCDGRPAEWIAWRANCCPESPSYVLICSPCKKVYQTWMAQGAVITCANCCAETGGFLSYTELNRKA